jgi:hypothetical protein
MFTRLWSRRREDDGMALMLAVSLTAMSGILIVTLVGLAARENKDTSHNRGRSAAITTAEGAVDATLAAIQEADVSTLPCGGTTTSKDSVPDAISITTDITYYYLDPATNVQTALPTSSCPPSETLTMTQVLVKAVATSTPRGGGLPVKREFETLAALKPQYSTDLNKAIFGQAGIAVGNNMDLYGEGGQPNADVYTNGNFTCSNNEHFRGSIVAPQGSVILNNSCVVDVDVYARDGVTLSSPGSIVNGNVKVSAGTVNLSSGTIVGKAYVTQTSSWCSANPAKCTVTTPVRIPAVQTFPQLNGDAATVSKYTAAGYTVVTLTECDPKLPGSPGYWLENSAGTITTPTLLKTPCRVDVQNNAKTISLNNDVAIFADRGVEIQNSITIQSKVAGQKHQILWIHPYDWQTRATGLTCNDLGSNVQTKGYGIVLTQLVTMSPDVNELLYSPCNVNKANQSTVYGQIYSGGIANVANKTDAYYRPVSVLDIVSTKVVLYYQADILYKRESTG